MDLNIDPNPLISEDTVASILEWVLLLGVPVFAGIFAAILASFACVVFERGRSGLSINGRSKCVCGKVIPWWFNVPIIGWLVQGGVAKCCGAKIPAKYVICESLCFLVAVLTFLFLPWLLAVVVTLASIIFFSK